MRQQYVATNILWKRSNLLRRLLGVLVWEQSTKCRFLRCPTSPLCAMKGHSIHWSKRRGHKGKVLPFSEVDRLCVNIPTRNCKEQCVRAQQFFVFFIGQKEEVAKMVQLDVRLRFGGREAWLAGFASAICSLYVCSWKTQRTTVFTLHTHFSFCITEGRG